MNNSSPLISIVVATKNEPREIARLLTSIQAQTFKDFEVICIDDSNTDETADVIKSFGYTPIIKGPERSAKRNEGIRIAKGQWILWLDADMSLGAKTLEACLNKISASNFDYLTIQEQIPATTIFTKVRNFENELLLNTVISVPRFIKADLLKSIGGFDENLTGAEDWDMEKRLKMKSPKKGVLRQSLDIGITHHEEQLTYKRFLEKKKYYATGCLLYEKKWGSNDEDVKRQLHAIPRAIHLLSAKGNLIAIFSHPLLFTFLFLFKALPSLFIYRLSQ